MPHPLIDKLSVEPERFVFQPAAPSAPLPSTSCPSFTNSHPLNHSLFFSSLFKKRSMDRRTDRHGTKGNILLLLLLQTVQLWYFQRRVALLAPLSNLHKWKFSFSLAASSLENYSFCWSYPPSRSCILLKRSRWSIRVATKLERLYPSRSAFTHVTRWSGVFEIRDKIKRGNNLLMKWILSIIQNFWKTLP